MPEQDITGKSHWDNVYTDAPSDFGREWKPTGYADLCLEHMLMMHIEKTRPRTILEVGCGNSTWLPYLAKRTSARVAGMDYSEQGCELARNNLAASGVDGDIICGDIFQLKPEETGTFDFVYSLGLVEHFDSLETVISRLMQFVSPGGVLLSEVPNLLSVHGLMVYAYQPELLAKHKIVTVKQLVETYEKLQFHAIDSGAVGIFSMGIVAWGIEQRFPRLDPLILPLVKFSTKVTDRILRRGGCYRGVPLFAPFLYAVGKK